MARKVLGITLILKKNKISEITQTATKKSGIMQVIKENNGWKTYDGSIIR